MKNAKLVTRIKAQGAKQEDGGDGEGMTEEHKKKAKK